MSYDFCDKHSDNARIFRLGVEDLGKVVRITPTGRNSIQFEIEDVVETPVDGLPEGHVYYIEAEVWPDRADVFIEEEARDDQLYHFEHVEEAIEVFKTCYRKHLLNL